MLNEAKRDNQKKFFFLIKLEKLETVLLLFTQKEEEKKLVDNALMKVITVLFAKFSFQKDVHMDSFIIFFADFG